MQSVEKRCMAAVDLWIKKQERGETPFVLSNDSEFQLTISEGKLWPSDELRAVAKQGDKTWLVDMQGNAEDVSDSTNFGSMITPPGFKFNA
jgi:hypothetical protein